MQWNPVNTDSEGRGGGGGGIETVHIKRVEFRDNVKAFFPQGQIKQFLITSCPY